MTVLPLPRLMPRRPAPLNHGARPCPDCHAPSLTVHTRDCGQPARPVTRRRTWGLALAAGTTVWLLVALAVVLAVLGATWHALLLLIGAAS